MRGLQTLSSGENSAVDTESEDMAEGGLAWADRSDREVDVLLKDMWDMTYEILKKRNHVQINHYSPNEDSYIYKL